MKLFIVLLLAGFGTVAVFTSLQQKTETALPMTYEPIALVELFTSQGCSSCPPADKLLGKIIESGVADNKHLYALSFHVDYWNRLGWKDPFSKQAFSARQQNYATTFKLNSTYTPQVIVNGSIEFVGSNSVAMARALKNALGKPATTRISSLQVKYANAQEVIISYALEGDFAGSTLHAAVVCKTATTNVRRGENGGQLLTNNSIVRTFVSNKANAKGELRLHIADLEKSNTEIVLFVQQDNGQITGAIKTSLPN